MKKTPLTIAVGVTVLLAWSVIVPGIVGHYVEAELSKTQEDVINASNLPISAKLLSFNRGWYSSTAKVEYQVKMGVASRRMEVDYHVNQFAIPFYRWSRVTWSVSLIDEQGVVRALPVPVSMVTDKQFFGGGLVTTVTLEKFDQSDDAGHRFMSSGGSLVVSGKPGETVQYVLSVPFIGMEFQESGHILSANLNKIQWNGSGSNNTDIAAVWSQQSHLGIGSIQAGRNGEENFLVSNVVMDAAMKDKGTTVDMQIQTGADKVQFVGAIKYVVNEIKLNFAYLNLSKQVLLDMQSMARKRNAELVQADQSTPVTRDALSAKMAQDSAFLFKQFNALLASSPGFEISQLSMKTPDGDISGKLEVRFDGKNGAGSDMNETNMMDYLKEHISGKGSLRVARDVVVNSFTADHAEREQKIKMMVEQGYVRDEGKELTLEATYGADGMMLNGRHIM